MHRSNIHTRTDPTDRCTDHRDHRHGICTIWHTHTFTIKGLTELTVFIVQVIFSSRLRIYTHARRIRSRYRLHRSYPRIFIVCKRSPIKLWARMGCAGGTHITHGRGHKTIDPRTLLASLQYREGACRVCIE